VAIPRQPCGAVRARREAHLSRYLIEFDFRYNNRHISDSERAALLTGNLVAPKSTKHRAKPSFAGARGGSAMIDEARLKLEARLLTLEHFVQFLMKIEYEKWA
jgi:hypothetical protein